MKKQLTTLAILALSASAMAAPATTSTGSTTTTTPSLVDTMTLGYFTEYAGVKLDDTSNTDGTNAWTSVKLKAKPTKDITAFMSHAFTLNQTSTSATGEDQDTYAADDVRVGASMGGKYSDTISNSNSMELEFNDGMAGNQAFRLRATHSASTTINYRHNLSAGVQLRKWFHDNVEDQEAGSQHALLPNVSYSYTITDKLSAMTDYTASIAHQEGSALTSATKGYQELYVGVNYSVAKALNLGAFLFMNDDGDTSSKMRATEDARMIIQLSGTIL